MEKSLIIIPQKVDYSKAKNLYKEFLFAWKKTGKKEKIQWSIDSTKLFGKVILRRGRGFVEFIQYVESTHLNRNSFFISRHNYCYLNKII